ncbi:uncharacterized protein [Leptinotarsa decemlineata]|uniref:uncharacterized protein n=1 Tax=Leptinotarsa decemlineata TaxID=7539 RepID=UPI003D30BFE7
MLVVVSGGVVDHSRSEEELEKSAGWHHLRFRKNRKLITNGIRIKNVFCVFQGNDEEVYSFFLIIRGLKFFSVFTDMEEFLNNLGLNDLIGIFEENDVTLDIAKRLTDEEMILPFGKRKIFNQGSN